MEDGLRLTITVRSGAVSVQAVPGAALQVQGGKLTAEGDGRYLIDSASGAIEVRCDESTDVSIGTTSGKVECRGQLGELSVTTGSGSVSIERAARADVRTKSARVEVGECAGACTVRTKSGTVEVRRAGQLDLTTTSGRLSGTAVSEAAIQSVSGQVELSIEQSPEVHVQAQSGSVTIELPAGCSPITDLHTRSGRVRSECAPGGDGQVDVETTSGSITVSCR
jgi:DUF4097 and DUF4098 domain-containing protein YvlB